MNRREELLKDIREITAQFREEVPGGHKAWPKSIKDRVLELFTTGMNSTQVANATGIAYFTVHNWKRRAGTFKALQLAAPKNLPVKPTASCQPILIVTMTMPNGVRIEGVPFEQAIAFARRFK